MRRRRFLALLGAGLTGASVAAPAQQGLRIARIGFLGNSTAALEANLVGPFREGLRDHGYVEGQTIAIAYRWAEGSYDRLPALAAELRDLPVDVIVTAGTPAALAVKKVAPKTPCVMVAVGDPVGTGLIASLALPGGHMTGLTSIAPELEGKRLALLREVLPRLGRVAALWNPLNAYHVVDKVEIETAAARLGIDMRFVAVRTSPDLDKAFADIAEARPDALLVLADRVFLHNRAPLAAFTTERRLPGIYAYRELVEAGGLMSYGPSYADMHRRAADYVDKILHGEKAGDLPVQRPAKFELLINLRAARKLGLELPPSLLARADEVIE